MNQISGARFLITGGAGFVGSTIADQLITAGASEVRIIDNFVRGTWSNVKSALASGKVKVTEGDIRDADLVDRLTEGVDYVFHQAALRITRCAEAPREATEVLMTGTLNVLESAVRHKVKKIVAASSASVYGEPSYLPIDEAHPFNNRTIYGAGKVANEQMYRAYYTTSGLPYVALRYFNVYGPRMDLTGVYTEVLIRWLDAIEAGKPPLIFGDGEQSMDFVFINDVAKANILSLQSDVTRRSIQRWNRGADKSEPVVRCPFKDLRFVAETRIQGGTCRRQRYPASRGDRKGRKDARFSSDNFTGRRLATVNRVAQQRSAINHSRSDRMSTATKPAKTIPVAKPYFGVEEEHALVAALRSGWVSQGPKVAEFEKRFAQYVGTEHAVARFFLHYSAASCNDRG